MLSLRGVSYLVDDVSPDVLRRDLRVIRDDLHCTDVMLIGTDTGQLARAGEHALALELAVHLRPHLPDRPWRELLAHLARTAAAAEELRTRHPGRVTLLVGTELSFTAPGMVPAPWSYLRLLLILRAHRLLRRRINRRLDILLIAAERTARACFSGPITYGAASWEEIDWSRFDLVGVNLYRTGTNRAAYEHRVRTLVREAGKPVVITEFGCGAFVGADRRGPGSFRIVNWFSDQPRIRGNHPRDEETQAGYLAELIDLYRAAGAHGCFVFTFSMTDFPHRDDPHLDLDKAGFGIVKVPEDDRANWEPKRAFHEVARQYDQPADPPTRSR